jgi:hypothetical protein
MKNNSVFGGNDAAAQAAVQAKA